MLFRSVAWITPPVSPLAAYWSCVTGAYHLMFKERREAEGVARGKWEKEKRRL